MQEVGVRYGMGKVAIKATVVKAMRTAGFSIEGYKEEGPPLSRASAWINKASQGYIKLVGTAKEWEAFTAQWWTFPNGHDDSVDAVSGVVEMLGWVLLTSAKREKQPAPYEFVDRM